ncbi:hypothetical protein WJX73_002199 [Symbiochloris irregularis]|uniref:Uncharacterized protein n=1 Tax=Symbiochloris irregularis TaxID=706552 RepID=A0AAW1NMP7_9CHLO
MLQSVATVVPMFSGKKLLISETDSKGHNVSGRSLPAGEQAVPSHSNGPTPGHSRSRSSAEASARGLVDGVAPGRPSESSWTGRQHVAAGLLSLPPQQQHPTGSLSRQGTGNADAARTALRSQRSNLPKSESQDSPLGPSSPGFWAGYVPGEEHVEDAAQHQDHSPASRTGSSAQLSDQTGDVGSHNSFTSADEVKLEFHRCTLDARDPTPITTSIAKPAKRIPGISSRVLALLQQSGTSSEAIAELAGISICPLIAGSRGIGARRTSSSNDGSAHLTRSGSSMGGSSNSRWDVEPAVCWAGVCGGHKPRASMADQQEGGSLLPPSEQQTEGVGFQRGAFRNGSYEADLNRLDEDATGIDEEGRKVSLATSDGAEVNEGQGPFQEIVTVAHTANGPGVVQDSWKNTDGSSTDTATDGGANDTITSQGSSNNAPQQNGNNSRRRLFGGNSARGPRLLGADSGSNTTTSGGPSRGSSKQLPDAYASLDSHLSTLSSSSSVRETSSLNVDSFKGATFVNQYVVIRTLGQGSYGKVKLVLDSKDHKLYAIKLINKSRVRMRNRLIPPRSLENSNSNNSSSGSHNNSSNPAAHHVTIDDDVLREIWVMKQLSHPNVVQLVEVIDDPQGSKLLMVLEYVEGGPVLGIRGGGGGRQNAQGQTPKRDWQPVSEPVARAYFRDVIQGLDYLHANRIVHGDCKPDNLLLGADGHVKISDFGSSRMLGGGDASMMLRAVGTPAFLAPEVCAGLPYHGRAADLWALGICLYAFVYGTVPFKAPSILALYDDIRTAPLTFPTEQEGGPRVSLELQNLLEKMLEKDPADRIDMHGIMAHPWVCPTGTVRLTSLQEGGPRQSVAAVTRKSLAMTESCNRQAMRGLVQLVTSLFEQRRFKAGDMLARQGTPASTMFYLQEGVCEIVHDLYGGDPDEDFVEEADSFSSSESPLGVHRPPPRMLATMLDATQRAVQHVEPARAFGEDGLVVTTRGQGQFIGEVSLLEPSAAAPKQMWRTSVRAKTPVAVLMLTQACLRTLLDKAPQAEAQVRAAMAQRRSELLKLETLERIAAFHSDLSAMAEPAS